MGAQHRHHHTIRVRGQHRPVILDASGEQLQREARVALPATRPAEQCVPEAALGRGGERESPCCVAGAGGREERGGGEEVGARGGGQGVGERLGGEGANEAVPAAAEERGQEAVHVVRRDGAAELDERRERRRRRGFAAGKDHGGRCCRLPR